MKKHTTKYDGLDVHKDTIVSALADRTRDGVVRHYGDIAYTLTALDKFLCKQVSQRVELRGVHEAGPTGYEVFRRISALTLFLCTIGSKFRIVENYSLTGADCMRICTICICRLLSVSVTIAASFHL